MKNRTPNAMVQGMRTMSLIWILGFVLFFLGTPASGSEKEISLPVIRVTGLPAESIMEDSLIPPRVSRKGKLRDSGNGTLLDEMRSDLTVSTAQYGAAGGVSQLRGLGHSADDVNVQSLGVPLNGPQGGGFDFSTFPQYLWSGYRMDIGPSSAAYDPRAVSGTLTLSPWVSEKLDHPGSGALAGFFASSAGLRQYYGGFHGHDKAAILAGYSSGRVAGPSVSAYGQAFRNPRWLIRGGGIGTFVKSKLSGSKSFPTPKATQLTSRWIPVLQADVLLGEQSILKNSVYYDHGTLKTEDPEHSYLTAKNRSTRLGSAHLWNSGVWKATLGAQYTTYDALTFHAPEESIFNASVSRRLLGWGIEIEPEMTGTQTSKQGFFPGGGLGFRKKFEVPLTLSFKGTYSRKFPTLVDRYYADAYYVGNPGLSPEEDWTAIFTARWDELRWGLGLTAFNQERDRTLILSNVTPTTTTRINQGSSRVRSLMLDGRVFLFSGVEADLSISLNYSRVDATRMEFPYIPRLASVSGLRWFSEGDPELRELFVRWKGQSSAVASSLGARIRGYGTVDLGGRIRVLKSSELIEGTGVFFHIRAENIFDRIYESVLDYPSEGRVVAGGVQARF